MRHLTDNQNKKNTDPDIPISAADLASKPPRIHIKDMNPSQKGRAVMSADEFGKKSKRKPLPRKQGSGGNPKLKKKIPVNRKRISDDSEEQVFTKPVYEDEGKVFRFVGQKGVKDSKNKAQRRRFVLGMLAGVGLFFAVGGYMLASKPPPDKLVKPPKKIDSAKQLVTFTTAALSKRTSLIRSFSYEGVISDRIKRTNRQFSISFQQPSMLKVEIPEEGQTYIFDGAILSVQDRFERALFNKNLLKSTKAEQYLELNDLFGPFMVEGWRAPFLHENPNHLTGEVVQKILGPLSAEGWSIETPILDEKLRAMIYVFRKGTADFLYRQDMSHRDRILRSVWVLKEHQDSSLGFSFPQHWEEKDEFNRSVKEVVIKNISINQDLEQNLFDTATPTGLDLIEGPEGGFKEAPDLPPIK